MCGFAGIFAPGALDERDRAALARMGPTIAHRGPDAATDWTDDPAGIGFAHRRLAIIDVSEAGAQPMTSASGRYVIAYNGEIYNFEALRAALGAEGKAPAWRGHSDTEVVLAAIEAWGVAGALGRLEGMFGLGLWDRQERRLTLARDRAGEKPVYYGWQGEGTSRRLLFGSDLAALRVHPAFAGEIDRQAIELLCRRLYIPEPLSAYRGIGKLPPGSFVTIDRDSGRETVESYYDLAATAVAARRSPFAGGGEEAVEALDRLLGDAVARQMVSDVPLGAFLSGGIDSSIIVALMQKVSAAPVKTFTIGFTDKRYDESAHARAVAAHLGTDHHELVVEPADALAVIPRLPEIYSEPFADSSQIPTYLVSTLARQHVTVALSGDAGDELFGGYNRHRYALGTWPLIARAPQSLRAAAGGALRSLSPSAWDQLLGRVTNTRLVGDKVHKVADLIASRSTAELYDSLISANPDSARLTLEPSGAAEPDSAELPGWTVAESMMLRDALGYLPGDILTKVDRASMAVSLESRVPFLDPRVIEFAWSLPIAMKIRGGQTKWPLRALLDRYVPRALIDRPKMGFGIPIGDWLRGPLREWAEELLSPGQLADSGLFRPDTVRSLWALHLSGARNFEHRLWPVLMTQAWLASLARCARS